jgi:hypothetical protein
MEDTMTLPVPPDLHTLLIRADYSDEATWETIRAWLSQPDGDGFTAGLTYVEDAEYDGLTPEALWAMAASEPEITHAVLADRVTMTDPEHPLLVVDLYDEDEDEADDDPDEAGDEGEARPRAFRAVPDRIASITANLDIANMDFEEFAAAVDADGVFRGFR